MAEKLASVIYQSNFDTETLEVLNELRRFRLKVLEGQLADLPAVMKELADRNLYRAATADASTEGVQLVLEQKIKTLRERLSQPVAIYTDEIDLYLDLMILKESKENKDK